MGCDGVEDVVISTNSMKKTNSHANSVIAVSLPDGVICAKASMLLQVTSELNITAQVSNLFLAIVCISFFEFPFSI